MRRFCLIAGLAFALTASAAPRRPSSALGSAKDDDFEVPAGPAASPARCSDADTALARGLTFAFEPAPLEIRVIAIEDLALLADPRALNPLAQLVFDPQPAVQAAAVRTISRFSTARAEEILSNVVRHPATSEKIKLQAIRALVFQRSPTAREMLAQVEGGAGYNQILRSAAREALADWGPLP